MYNGPMRHATAESALADARAWYDEHAREFCDQTADLPMDHAYRAFLPLVPEGGRILDAGCGGGRDSRRFLDAGYRVEAFDASPEMARRAASRTGLPVRVLGFLDLDGGAAFHGVFANASLIHVPPEDLEDALRRLAAVLLPGGVLFASFKRGRGVRLKDGRLPVWGQDEESLRALAARVPGLELLDLWDTPDTRPERAGERWLHLLARRAAPEVELPL